METNEQIGEIARKVDEMYSALIGNELTKDGGMIKRLDEVESKVELLVSFKNRFIWTVGIIIGLSGIAGFLLNIIVQFIIK